MKTKTNFSIGTYVLKSILLVLRGAVKQGSGKTSTIDMKKMAWIIGRKDELGIMTNSGKMGGSCKIPNVEIRDPFSIAIDFGMLSSIVANAENLKLDFEIEEGHVTIHDGVDTYNLMSLDPNLMERPPNPNTRYCTMDLKLFKNMFSKPLKVTGVDRIAGDMSRGVMFYGDKAVGATQQYLSLVELPYPKPEFPMFIPREFLRELLRMTGFAEFDMFYDRTSLMVIFKKGIADGIWGEFKLYTHQLSRDLFPDYTVVTEQKYTPHFSVSIEDIRKKLSKLKILDNDNTLIVKATQLENIVEMKATDIGKGDELIAELNITKHHSVLEETHGLALKHLLDVASTFNDDEDILIATNEKKSVFAFFQKGHEQYLVATRLE